jgi:O-antigen ligase
MSTTIKNFTQEIETIDKYLLVFIGLIPISLAMSIFMADLFGSAAGITLIYIFLKKDIAFLKPIKKEIFLMIVFYSIILISLFLSNFFKHSFLASFFYFRYFLVSLSIFYLLSKYEFIISIFFYIILATISLVVLDSFYQYFNGHNLFGYTKPEFSKEMSFLTSFFNQEKKLGSYMVRFLPLILALMYLYKEAKYSHLNKYILLVVGLIIINSSERTALFLYFITLASFILINKKKVITILISLSIILILSTLNPMLKKKYIDLTLNQMELVESRHYNSGVIRYISREHENLMYTALINFKGNFLFGSGVKTFHPKCKEHKKKYFRDRIGENKKRNKLVCSTHPHSTYFQLLSDIGIFGFLIFFYFLCYIILTFYKILFKVKKKEPFVMSYYFVNLGMLIATFPLIPSGNIFNNWICLISYCTFGFWLFIKKKVIHKNL